MGNWNDVLNEVDRFAATHQQQVSEAHDLIRRQKLKDLHQKTGRNIVAYYSGWLSKSSPDGQKIFTITDEDKNGFMTCFHRLERRLGLDLVLHSPGGDVAATESLIDYVRQMFGSNVRTFVPQISMSGGTMMALMGTEIFMGTQSNIGPIDPQFGGVAAIALLQEFERAATEIKEDPSRAEVWRHIIGKYSPTILSAAKHAIDWSEEIAIKTLTAGMLKGKPKPVTTAKYIAEQLLSHDLHHAHGRHLHRDECKAMGLNIVDLEDDNELQDAVLSVHHAYTITLMNTPAAKIIENHIGKALVKTLGVNPNNNP